MIRKPQTIQIYLPFGDPQGIRIGEITTRTVEVYDVPRSEISTFFEMPESDQVALYFLFGDDAEDSQTGCYIGKTGASRIRFRDHLRKKDFWTRALICVSRTNTMTETHISYLEWRSIQAANDAGRYALENGNAGSRPHTPRPLEAECEDIFEAVGVLVGTMGFPVFRALATREPASPENMLFCRGRGIEARGVYSTDGLTVMAGSQCSPKATQKATADSLKVRRQKLLDDGALKLEDGIPVFQRDVVFKSPSGASQMVLFRSSNGWSEWKSAGGQSLSDIVDRTSSSS